eukprot:6675509-Alexandrium_andersonii.AAC.1
MPSSRRRPGSPAPVQSVPRLLLRPTRSPQRRLRSLLPPPSALPRSFRSRVAGPPLPPVFHS